MARILGLDIEDHSVRAVLVRSSFGRVEPQRYFEVPVLAEQPPADEADADAEANAAERLQTARRGAIQQILGSIRPPADQVFAGLDGKEASMRLVEVPSGAAKRLDEVLPFQLDDLVPFDISDTIVDHQTVSDIDGTLTVLATAVPNATVAARLAELKSLGIDPRGLPVGAAALDGLVALVPELLEGGPYLLLEIESGNTELCVIENGTCTYARSIGLGIAELSEPRKQAQFASTLRRSLGGYRAGGGAALTAAFLAGDAILYAEALAPLLASALDSLPIEPLPMPAAPGADPEHRPRYARAAALAGRAVLKGKRIDVRQGEFTQKRAMGELRKHGRLVGVCAAAILMSFIFATYARYSVLADENDALGDQLAEVTNELFDERTRSAARAQELLGGGSADRDPLPTMDAYDVLDAITAAIPPEITHDTRRLDIEVDDEAREGRFDLQGTVASIAERDAIVTNLDAHPCFGGIDPGSTSSASGSDRLNYRVEGEIRCPGDEPIVAETTSRRRGGGRSE